MARPILNIPSRRLSITELNVVNWMTEVAQFIIDFQENHGRVASGDSINNTAVSLVKKGRISTVSLAVPEHTQFALQGRGPGGQPPINAIEAWIRSKPISVSGDEEITSLAWAIAKKIASEGTLSGTGPDDTKLNPGLIAANVTKFGKRHLNTMSNELAKSVADGLFQTLSGSESKLKAL